MTSRTEDAVSALATALVRPELPTVNRAARLPANFQVDPTGAGTFLNIRKGSTEREDLIGGRGVGERTYELDHFAEIEWLVEHIDRSVRVDVFEAGLEAIDDALLADPTLGGVVTNAEISAIDFGGLATEGIAEIEAAIVTVRLTFGSERPF